MKTSLSIPLLALSVFILFFVGRDSITATNPQIEGIEGGSFAEEAFIAPSEGNDKLLSINNDITRILGQLDSPESDGEGLVTSDCEDEECQSCNGVGGYSQISVGSSSLIFDAFTFVQGSNPMCPCFSDISGTLTFEYKIFTYPAGQLITQGSTTQNLINGQSSSYCGFGYHGSALTNQFTYPHPGGDILVDLKTTHVAGSHPSQTFVHETSTHPM